MDLLWIGLSTRNGFDANWPRGWFLLVDFIVCVFVLIFFVIRNILKIFSFY